jgi:hypothetical protein
LDTPSIKVTEISNSFDLSIFSSRDGSQHDEGARVAPKRSSSASIGELWPNIDKLDGINHGGASVRISLPSVIRSNKGVRPAARGALENDALGPSTAPPRGRGRGSARK